MDDKLGHIDMMYGPSTPRTLGRQCKYCVYFVEMRGGAAVCREDGRIHLRSQPEIGCVFFEREAGTDDDLLG